MRALALAGSVLLSLPAFACINGMREKEREAPEMDLVARAAAKKLYERDYQGAAADATRVLSHKSSTTLAKRQARRTLGTARLRLGDLEGARTTLLEALKEQADEPVLLSRLGEAEVGLGKNQEAKARLEPLKEQGLLPDPEAHVALAKAYLALGEVAAAKAEVEEALKQQPGHPGATAMKAQLEKASPAAAPGAGKKPEARS